MFETLFNLKDYTPLELLLFNVGCSMWVVVYFIYVKNIHTKKFIEMPLIAAGSNFAWEWVWGFAFHTDMGLLPQWIYRAWIIVDLYIIWGVFKYGHKQLILKETKKMAVPMAIGSILLFSGIYYRMVAEGFDTPIGAHSAYACQLILSWCYVYLIISRKNTEGFSALAGWLRTYGTGLITIFMFMHYPKNHLLHIMAVAAFILDNIYLYTFYQIRKRNTRGEAQEVIA